MANTIGHSARHGGLRGHSIDPEIYPFIVVAKGDPSIPYWCPNGLRWYVRHPDGHLMAGNGFRNASMAHIKAKDAKRVYEAAKGGA